MHRWVLNYHLELGDVWCGCPDGLSKLLTGHKIAVILAESTPSDGDDDDIGNVYLIRSSGLQTRLFRNQFPVLKAPSYYFCELSLAPSDFRNLGM